MATRSLEELLHKAIVSRRVKATLKQTLEQIYVGEIEVFEAIEKARTEGGDAANRLALEFGPCQYASMTIRILMHTAYEADKKGSKDLSPMLSGEQANLFSGYMNRCELIVLRKMSKGRLVGSTGALYPR